MPSRIAARAGAGAAVVAAIASAAAWAYVALEGTATSRRGLDAAVAATGGQPDRGSVLITSAGCGACHVIPGIPGARGRIGPSLEGFGSRATVGGVLANNAANLSAWIEDPRRVDAKTAMPSLGLSRTDAGDIAAYLYAHTGT